MKNKKNIYFLLPAVLIVWGLLGYKIYSAIKPKNSNTNATPYAASFEPEEIQESEPFTIKADYRDPFLGTTPLTKRSKPKQKVAIKLKSKQPFPQIVYRGQVSGNTSQVFIISIDGKQFFFKKYQMQQDVKLINGNAKSVTLKFKGQQQTFTIAK